MSGDGIVFLIVIGALAVGFGLGLLLSCMLVMAKRSGDQ